MVWSALHNPILPYRARTLGRLSDCAIEPSALRLQSGRLVLLRLCNATVDGNELATWTRLRSVAPFGKFHVTQNTWRCHVFFPMGAQRTERTEACVAIVLDDQNGSRGTNPLKLEHAVSA